MDDLTVELIKTLLHQQNKSQKDLADYLGVPKQKVSNWMTGVVKSYQKYIPQIAVFLGVSVSDLFPSARDIPLSAESNTKENHPLQTNDLTTSELELLKAFRAADPALQRAALSVLKSGEQSD